MVETNPIATEESQQELVGQRIDLRGKTGSVRFVGRLRNNVKAGDALWIGVEWDEAGAGKHCGSVDGETYFECQFHSATPDAQCCSFLRFGKVAVGGAALPDALLQRYKPEHMMTEAEKKLERQKLAAEQFVTTSKGEAIQIEMVGFEDSYAARAELSQTRDVTLESMRISEVGAPGELRKLIPGVMNLYLDKNLLHSWDQYFQIIGQLPYLRLITLTGNKFSKIPLNYLEGKDVASLIHTSLSEVIFIDMGLDWEQILALAPILCYVEQLHLVRNQCSKISSMYQVPKDFFRLLKFINLEENGIESWDEVIEFRHLPNLKRLTLNKNRIKDIYYMRGFNDLYMLSMEENLIDNWKSLDALSEFPQIKNLRALNNPIFEEERGGPRARECAIARVQFVRTFNGTPIEDNERKDCEIFYINDALRGCLLALQAQPGSADQPKLEELDDPRLLAYMHERHPRWYQLVEIHGNPLGTIKLLNEKHNIATSSARVQLISEVEPTMGKTLTKKLLLSMTVNQLKAMCAKLFKVEVTAQTLMYVEEGVEGEFDFDEEYRQLSFYSIKDGGIIYVRPFQQPAP